jgi:hypothetical protein
MRMLVTGRLFGMAAMGVLGCHGRDGHLVMTRAWHRMHRRRAEAEAQPHQKEQEQVQQTRHSRLFSLK